MTSLEEAAQDGRPVTLADLEVGEPIGHGTFATVFRATAPDGRPVALKCWHRSLDDEGRRRFRRECGLQWSLADEPHIARLLWADAPREGRPWMAVELFDESLAARMAREPVPPDLAVDLLIDLLEGLAAVHRSGHLHRDVKPGNVLLRAGRAALTDLGLAMVEDGATVDAQAGTPAYLAPELVLHRASPSRRTDVYSAARTAEQLFAGRAPAALVPVLDRALSHAPADRYADAAAFLDAVRRAQAGDPPEPRDAIDPVDAMKPDGRRGRPGRRSLVAALAVALLIGGALARAAEGRRGTSAPHREPVQRTLLRGDLPGWRQTFADGFDQVVPTGSFVAARAGQWFVYDEGSATSTGGVWAPDEVLSQHDGLLDLHLTTDAQGPLGAALVTLSPGGPRDGAKQTYGRFSFRLRATPTPGYFLSFWLYPDQNPDGGSGIYAAAGHLDDSLDATVDSPTGDALLVRRHLAGSFTGWHTITLDWTPRHVQVSVDGRESELLSGNDVPHDARQLVLQVEPVVGPGQPVPGDGHVLVDWVTSYQLDPTAR